MGEGITHTIVVAVFIGMGVVVLIITPVGFIFYSIKMVQGGITLAGKGIGALTGFAKNLGGSYESSRGRKMRKEAREAGKQKAFLDRLNRVPQGRSRVTRGINALRGKAGRGINTTFTGGRTEQELQERLYGASQKLEAEKVEQLNRRLTRSAALALASGAKVGRDGKFTDVDGKEVKLNAEDMNAYNYARSIGADNNITGARAVGGFIHQLAEMNETRLNNLVDMGRNPVERAQINNDLNKSAQQHGQWQWAYNDFDQNTGKLAVAAQKSGMVENKAAAMQSIIESKGVAALPKETYDPNYFDQGAIQTAIRNAYSTNKDGFIRQTLNINEGKKLAGVARAINIVARDSSGNMIDQDGSITTDLQKAQIAGLEQERKRVGQAYST